MNKQEKKKLIKLLKQFPKIIKREQDKLNATNILKHKIRTTDEDPIYTRSYRYPQIYKENIKVEIEKLLKNNIIQASNSSYNSPIWVGPKETRLFWKEKN